MDRIVSFLANLVAIVCLATPGAHLEPRVDLLAIAACLILTLLVLVKGRQLAIAFLGCVAVPQDVALQTVHQTLA